MLGHASEETRTRSPHPRLLICTILFFFFLAASLRVTIRLDVLAAARRGGGLEEVLGYTFGTPTGLESLAASPPPPSAYTLSDSSI